MKLAFLTALPMALYTLLFIFANFGWIKFLGGFFRTAPLGSVPFIIDVAASLIKLEKLLGS